MKRIHLVFAFTLTLVACGGGGGNSTNSWNSPVAISGTAATGFPIANTAVLIKDKNGNTVSETTSSDGSYSADVTNMTAPYLIKVDNLYSIATASGTANVHPFTDMIIRNWFMVQGLDVDTVFAAAGAIPSLPTAIEIATIESTVRQILLPYLSNTNIDPATFNLITTPFNADHTGFDLILDNLTVTQPAAPGGDITIYDNGLAANILTVPETTSLTTAPTVTGFSPISGAAGTTVTITGTNFSATPANNIVSFGGNINATVTAATTNSLTVTVPGGAITGAISVATTGGSVTSANTFTLPGSAAGSMTNRYFHTATLLPNGKVLVTGGEGAAFTFLSSADIYDPATSTWSAAGNMATVRTQHTATLLPNGKVLVAGGWMGFNPLASAELYDPMTNTWTSTASMMDARFGHTATLLPNGAVLVVGGANAGGSGALASAEIYNPITNAWTPAGTMATARQKLTATLLPNSKVLITGGGNGGGGFATTELYDTASNTWSAAASMIGARARHTATLLPNGKVLATGGYDSPITPPLASAELYDPAANTWTAATNMSVARLAHTATLLPNGMVLVTAGAANGDFSVELYDPGTNNWSTQTSMTVARTNHTATLLSNGMVLVMGGASPVSTTAYDTPEIIWGL